MWGLLFSVSNIKEYNEFVLFFKTFIKRQTKPKAETSFIMVMEDVSRAV